MYIFILLALLNSLVKQVVIVWFLSYTESSGVWSKPWNASIPQRYWLQNTVVISTGGGREITENDCIRSVMIACKTKMIAYHGEINIIEEITYFLLWYVFKVCLYAGYHNSSFYPTSVFSQSGIVSQQKLLKNCLTECMSSLCEVHSSVPEHDLQSFPKKFFESFWETMPDWLKFIYQIL